jgi:hypothetical protein
LWVATFTAAVITGDVECFWSLQPLSCWLLRIQTWPFVFDDRGLLDLKNQIGHIIVPLASGVFSKWTITAPGSTTASDTRTTRRFM